MSNINNLKKKRALGIIVGIIGLIAAFLGFNTSYSAHKCIKKIGEQNIKFIGEKIEGCEE